MIIDRSDFAAKHDAGAREQALFALDTVSFSIGGKQLLRPLTMTVQPGRITCLLGHNGSGKSTLLTILARQRAATTGTVRFAGQPLPDWEDRAFARRLAYLPQQTPATGGMLVRELVALGRYPWHGPLGRFTGLDREKVEEAMVLTDLVPLADRVVETLSGGERQRAWMAMTVAQDADCLLLDEPISALDVAHQIEILSLIQRLNRTKRLSVVIVLHDVNMAVRFCEDFIALRSGAVVFRGTAKDLMVPDVLRDIYGVNMIVMPHPTLGLPLAMPG